MEPSSSKNVPVNYLYFGAFFCFLTLIAASSVFAKEHLSGSRFFFFLYAMGQAMLETALFIFLGWMIRRFIGNIAFLLFIGATFLFLILHLLDFLMERILDLSIWETIAFVTDESWDSFLYLLDASGISMGLWILLFSLVLLLPLLGIVLYRACERITALRPLALRSEWFLQAFFCLPAALFFWDFSASKVIHPDTYTAFLQSLPWKWTFLQPKSVVLDVSGPLPPPLSETFMREQIHEDRSQLNLAKKPNIYLFVVESLRGDILTEEVAPHLSRFKQEAVQVPFTLSNGNGSHLSWFSIFHSQFPHFWHRLQEENWEMGSPPLQVLKKWGYQIRLYSSAQLGYYGMETLLFGKERQLVDSYQAFHHAPPSSAAESDAKVLAALQNDLAKDPSLHEGQVFIIFWDATHFDYSWPTQWSPKFTPFAKEFAYFKAFYSREKIELIKNRYRNAVHYMDSLFGAFLSFLPDPEEAIVFFTGDHGEEFFERGHLFHGSHLIHEQTCVPILMRFGSTPPFSVEGTVSQMDLFPSLLHYLSGASPSFLEGQSIFLENRWPYSFIARFNAGRTPYEFCLHNGRYKLIAQFLNRRDIFSTSSLRLRSLRGAKDEPMHVLGEEVIDFVDREFAEALHRLFPQAGT